MVERKTEVIILTSVMGVLAIAAVMLRFTARRIKRSPLESDDYTILAALLLVIGVCISTLIAVTQGNLGGHDILPNGKPAITPHMHEIRSTALWVGQWLTVLAVGLTKASILLFYKRIFLGRVFLVSTNIMMTITILWSTAYTLTNIFGCQPVSLFWAVSSQGHCIEWGQFLLSQAISDTIIDALILILPWYPVYNLHMPLTRKLLVCAIFLLGGFVVAAGIVRAVEVDITFKTPKDGSFVEALANDWNTIEVCIGVVSACLPVLRPLFGTKGAESIIRVLQSRLPSSWSKVKLVDQDSSRPSLSARREASTKGPLIYNGKSGEGERHQVSAEATELHKFQNPSDADGIMVYSSFSHYDTRV